MKHNYFIQNIFNSKFYLLFSFFSILFGCLSEESSNNGFENDVEIVNLEEYETIISYEENILAVPSIIKDVTDSTFIVYDSGAKSILKLHKNGKLIKKYGREGRGPGEFINVENIFIVKNNVFILDKTQNFIHKFNQKGDFKSTIKFTSQEYSQSSPPPPLPPLDLSYLDIGSKGSTNNQIHITLNEDLLQLTQNNQRIYKLTDLKGNLISKIGEYPEGSTSSIDFDRFKSEIRNKEVPSLFKSNVFIVDDLLNTDEFYFIFNAIPMIAKYDSNGKKLWQNKIIKTPEVAHIEKSYYETMDQILNVVDTVLPLRKYTSGASSTEGDLYLSTYTYPGIQLWIHQFNSYGKLIRRYKLTSDVELQPVFDIDFNGRKILVATEQAEIRAYAF